MQFLKDIREHLKDFETEAQDEIHKFMDFLEKRYAPPTDAVPGPNPEPVGVETTPTYLVPDFVEATEEAPVVEATPEPEVVAEEPVETATTTESSVIATVDPKAFTCQPASE